MDRTERGLMAGGAWTTARRATWWLKFLSAVTAGIVSAAAAARVLGLSIDVQTKTAAAEQHATMARESDEKLERAISKMEAAVDRLGTRLDSIAGQRCRP